VRARIATCSRQNNSIHPRIIERMVHSQPMSSVNAAASVLYAPLQISPPPQHSHCHVRGKALGKQYSELIYVSRRVANEDSADSSFGQPSRQTDSQRCECHEGRAALQVRQDFPCTERAAVFRPIGIGQFGVELVTTRVV
jgi:hypothetical protein